MNNHTLFIADLHLESSESDTTKLFMNFLDNIPEQTDALYILGDLFKFWAGDDDNSNFNQLIKKVLKKTNRKTAIYLMPGNRDFLLGNRFAEETGCTLIHDPYVINLYGINTLLTHGDTISNHRTKYQIFRALVRIPWLTKLFLKLPLNFRTKIAKLLQQHSSRRMLNKNNFQLIPQQNKLKKLMAKFDFDQIIYGHVHRANQGTVLIYEKTISYISLGKWDNSTHVLKIDLN